MLTITQFLKAMRYMIFSSNLSVFDLFWITLLVHFAATSVWFILAFIPLIIISAYSKMVVEKEEGSA